MAAMTLEEFIAKYALGPNGTFLADDKGGNAASEVAGQNVADYYRTYLADGAAPRTIQVGGWDNPTEVPYDWGGGTTRDALKQQIGLDAWSNVDPHPESNRLDGMGEFWKNVGKPIATAAAMYYGVNGLDGLSGVGGGGGGFSGMGGAGGSAGAAGDFGMGTYAAGGAGDIAALSGNQIAALSPASSPFSFATPEIVTAGTGVDLGAIGTTAIPGEAAAAGLLGNQSAAETARLASMNAGANTLGGISPGSTIGSSSMFDTAGQFLKDNPTLARLGGAAIGALGSQDTTTSNSSNRDPWAPAQPYLRDNLATNAAMAEHYRANPFSELQQQQYQGLFNNLTNNQANAPGLLANASSFGQSNRGRMPAMQGLISGTQAPAVNWSAYQNIGRRG